MMDICPNGCKGHIPPIKAGEDLQYCKATNNTVDLKEIIEASDESEMKEGNVQMRVIITEIKALRTILNEEIRQRLHLITDVGNVRREHLTQWERIIRIEKHIHYLWKKLARVQKSNDNVTTEPQSSRKNTNDPL